MSGDFVTSIPNNIKSSIITAPPEDTPLRGILIFVANNTPFKSLFQRISAHDQFAKLYKNKAFLHWHKGENMDQMGFQKFTCCVLC